MVVLSCVSSAKENYIYTDALPSVVPSQSRRQRDSHRLEGRNEAAAVTLCGSDAGASAPLLILSSWSS